MKKFLKPDIYKLVFTVVIFLFVPIFYIDPPGTIVCFRAPCYDGYWGTIWDYLTKLFIGRDSFDSSSLVTIPRLLIYIFITYFFSCTVVGVAQVIIKNFKRNK